MSKFLIRLYQFIFYKCAYFLPWREPVLIEGNGCFIKLPDVVKNEGFRKPLVITDKGLMKINLLEPLFQAFDAIELDYIIFDNVEPNPKIDNIEDAIDIYLKNGCDCIIAVGGGSSMDTAKGVGARLARPKKSIEKLGGTLKVMRKIPMLYVVPTTAGTGSEATIASVVTNRETHHKYAINDLCLIPRVAVMDPMLHIGLPPFITATTGMDALTHAVESYINIDVPKKYKKYCEEAVVAIFKYIERAYNNGKDIEARKELLYASYKAGKSFTRCGLTYVHPIAHTLGGLYNLPHGLANAVILPYCLDYYGPKIYPKLAHLADLTKISKDVQNKEEKAKAFISEIRRLNKAMNLPDKIDCIQDKDIPQMVEWALKEAHPLYQVPVLLNGDQIKEIIDKIKV